MRIDRAARELGHDRRRGDLGMGVCHVGGLRHQRRRQDGITHDVNVPGQHGGKAGVVDLAPALVGIGQTGLDRERAGTHRRQHVQHVGLHVFAELELHAHRPGIDRHRLVQRPILDEARVEIGPRLLEEYGLRDDVGVGVEDQDLRAGLVLLEVGGDDACPLVGAGGAAVRRLGDGDREHAAVAHRLHLARQGLGLRPGLPRLQHLALGLRLGEPLHRVEHQFHAGRENELVIADPGAAGERHLLALQVDRGGGVLHDGHAVALAQALVGARDVVEAAQAAHDQIG